MPTPDGRAQKTARGQRTIIRTSADLIVRLPEPGEPWTLEDLPEPTDEPPSAERGRVSKNDVRYRLRVLDNAGIISQVETGKERHTWRTDEKSYEIAHKYMENREQMPCGCRVALGNRGKWFECLSCGERYPPDVARVLLGKY